MESGGGGGRRRISHSGEAIDSFNLRDFLRVREEDDGRSSLTGLTLSAILESEKRSAPVPVPVQVNQTLLDIIRDDPNNGGFKDSKKSWKLFRNKLRLRRSGAAWISTLPVPRSDDRVIIARRNSTSSATQPQISSSSVINNENNRVAATNSITNNRVIEAVVAAQEEEGGGESPVRMSLMALLAETDREMGTDGSGYMIGGGGGGDCKMELEEVEEEDHRSGGDSGGGGGYNNCCVCMVRHKGSAFIPCGHTFCRLCSREVWVQRGNCPLCNGFILEILDIF